MVDLLSQSQVVRPLFCSHVLVVINNAVMSILMHRAFPAFRLCFLDAFPEVGLLGHRIWTFL